MRHVVAVDRVDYPDGPRRVLFHCTSVDGCFEGHVEMRPAAVAEAVVERLVAEHEQAGAAVRDGEMAVIPW